MSWYKMRYDHLECHAVWHGEWSRTCNDRCPVCDKEVEPTDYVDLTAVLGFDDRTQEWVVSLSPPEAEDGPSYRQTHFKEKRQARVFLASSAYA